MGDRNYGRLFLMSLRVAAGAWIALAVWELFRLRDLRDMALVADEAPRDLALVLLPLGAAWAFVLWWSLSSTKMRLLGAVLAQALSLGAVVSVLVMVAPILISGPRTGPAVATTEFLASAFLVQLVAIFLARPVKAELRPQVSVSTKTVLGLGVGAALVSFGLTTAAGVRAPKPCVAPEAVAIGTLRSVLSAEVAYRGAGDRFGTLECLVKPHECLPDYPPEAPVFLSASDLRPHKCGYRFTFYAPTAPNQPSDSGSVDAFAVMAVPIALGRSGERGFCVDGTGAIRVAPDGRVPAPSDGRCDESLELLE